MLNQSMSTSNAIVTRDKFDVTHAAMLLCNFLGAQKVSIGTVWEIGVATAHAIPYVVVMEPDNIHRHPMVTNNAYAVLEDLEEAIRLVNLFLAPYLESQNGSE
jgi:nucleoside 2-deoxyribosyltransferase